MSMIGNFLQLSSEELAALIRDPSKVETFIYPDDAEHDRNIDVDKAWHGIHFLLTGDAWQGTPPLGNVVLGGTEIGGDVGYGPVRYLSVFEVQEVADALQTISPDDLGNRYDAAKLCDHRIYPEIWDEADAISYLTTWYETLRDCYLDAASKKNAMLKYFN